MVLDACVSLSPSETSLFAEGAANSDVVLKSFFSWCEQQNATYCPLKHANQSVEDSWTDLMSRSERSPIAVLACQQPGAACAKSTVNANDIRAAVYPWLYDFINFPAIAEILATAAFHHNASLLAPATITDDVNAYNASFQYATVVISCSDQPATDTPAAGTFKQVFASSEAPLMYGRSAVSQFQNGCVGWPAPKRNPPHVIEIPATPKMNNIFMTNNLYDPATPYGGACNLQQEIGDRAVLVTRNASGHSMFLKPDAYDGATMAALIQYLLTGEVPAQGAIYQS